MSKDKIILSPLELAELNEMMLGRGVPNQDDGIGYNKADYGICSNYFYGMSYHQLSDLAKRLVKYCNTQLGMDKELLVNTQNAYADVSKKEYSRDMGITVDVGESYTTLAFRYNPKFIELIRQQPIRKYSAETKQWSVPNTNAIDTLLKLREIGADVENAISYIEEKLLTIAIEKAKNNKISHKINGDKHLIKFDYNKDIVSVITNLNATERVWNNQYKYWTLSENGFRSIQGQLLEHGTFESVE